MAKFRMAAILACALGLAGVARAQDAPVVIDGVAQPIPVDERLAAGFGAKRWRDDMAKAIAGNCSPILERIAQEQGGRDWNDVWAKAELLDHGLCLEFDPAAAFKTLETMEEYEPGKVALWRGWKGYYGHGLPKADVKSVKQDFLRYLLSITWQVIDLEKFVPEQVSPNLDAQLLADLGARPVPPMLAEGVAWLKVQLSDRQKRLDLAQAMLWGGGVYADGTPVPIIAPSRDVELFLSTLVRQDVRANVVRARARMQGIATSRDGNVYTDLYVAARCLDLDAILYLIRFSLSGEYDVRISPVEAGMWVKVARGLGVAEATLAKAVGAAELPARSGPYKDVPELLSGSRCHL